MKIRERIKNFEPYAWENSNEQLQQRYGLREDEIVRFDMNTSPFTLRKVREAVERLAGIPQNEYPDPSYARLASAVARYAGVQERQVVICAGADEVIDVITKACIDNGTKAVISSPTYSLFKIAVAVMGGEPVLAERNADWSLDPDKLISAANSAGAKLVFICNPNSPTGNQGSRESIEKVLRGTRAVVAVDEAYVEFSGGSLVELVNRYENLVVIRTLSKAFGLAGARVGYAVASPEFALELNKVRPPNSISAPSVALAEAALTEEGIAEMRENVKKIVGERERMRSELSSLGFTVYPSVCNFLLVRCSGKGAGELSEQLKRKGLVLRTFAGKPGLENCLRITVRGREENVRLIAELRSLVGERDG